MKPFMGIDLTTDKKNETFNGDHFLVAKPSAAMAQSFEKSFEQAEETMERSKLPLVFRIVQFISGCVAALIFVGILKGMGGEDSVTLPEAYQNAPWLFWVGGACLVIWLVLKLISGKKEKTVLESDESTHTLSNLDKMCDSIYAELGVPADAKEVDILSFFYKVKDGEIKVQEKAFQTAPYLNPVFRIYSDAENLYLTNLEGKYAFPRSNISAIRTVKKSIRIEEWNKEEPLNKGVYKQYKLTTDNYDCVHCKCYHILEMNCDGTLWGIYFPSYELPVFEAATGLNAQ